MVTPYKETWLVTGSNDCQVSRRTLGGMGNQGYIPPCADTIVAIATIQSTADLIIPRDGGLFL
jgi:hypothetical protein